MYTVTVDHEAQLASVEFEAFGEVDLRSPRTSCLLVSGYRDVPVRDSLLAIDSPGHYKGTLTFSLRDSGSYSFQYSCSGDYSEVRLFDYEA
ncbi:hypothetical protein [Geodermatophilus sp. URMC 65]